MLKTPKIFVRLLLIGSVSAALLACQSSSQSSSSSSTPAPPSSSSSSPSSSSGSSSSQQSSSSSQSQGSSSSQPQSSGSRNRSSQSGGSSSTLGDGQSSGQGSQSGSQQGNSNQGNNDSNSGDSVSQNAGGKTRFPGDQQADGIGYRDGSSGELNSGNKEPSGTNLPDPSGDYSLDELPFGGVSGSRVGQSSQEVGAMTSAERAADLDERLRRGYETFDGFILSERERAQTESNAAGSVAVGGDGSGGGSREYLPQTLEEASAQDSVPQPPRKSAPSSQPQATFAPPEDIPSGGDDDVLAAQLREAAMSEPDPTAREGLWEAYRNYTGRGKGQ